MNIIKNKILKIAVILILAPNLTGVASVGTERHSTNITKIKNLEEYNVSKPSLSSELSSVVELDGLKYTVKSISRTDSNGVKNAANDRTFICVEMDVQNNTGNDSQITSVMNFSLTDTSGKWFNVVMPEGNDSVNGQLASGTIKSGKVYFDVDIDTTEFILTFRSRISGDKSIKINADGKIVNNSENNNKNNTTNNKEKYERNYEFDHTANCDYFRFNIGDIKVSNYYNGNFARDGFKFVYIDVEAENTGSYQDQITSSFMFEMRDENNNYYRIKLPEENGINSIINPNEKLSGKIVFEVEESSSNFTMRIKPWAYKSYEEIIDFEAK